MTISTDTMTPASPVIADAADAAARQIAPLWPLASFVAVNPFLGQTGETLAAAGARLARVGGVPVAMPRGWYLDRIDAGAITQADLAAALAAAPVAAKPADVAGLLEAARAARPAPQALPTVADLAAEASGTDWPGLLAERFGAWAGDTSIAGRRCGPRRAGGGHGPPIARTRRRI